MASNPKRTSQSLLETGDPFDDTPMGSDSQGGADTSPLIPPHKRTKVGFDFQGVPQELVDILNIQLGKLDIAVSNTLSKYKPTGSENRPWASEWKAGKLFVAAPLSGITVDGSLIDQVILCGLNTSRSRVVITAGQGCETVPDLSIEDERFLNGILSAMTAKQAPSTLKCNNSSIVDLTFYSLWNLAAARLLSDKQERHQLHPSVLPANPVKGGKASEYLTTRFSGLRATLGLQHAHIADTIERIVKCWSEEHASMVFDTLLQTKIPWSLVLSKGADFKVKTVGKGREKRRMLTTPLNPKASAWLMPAERKILSHLCSPIWGAVDEMNKEWAKLSGEQTHAMFESYVNRVKTQYTMMRSISESMTKRLGLRKSIILASPAVKQLNKKDLKNLPTSQLITLFSRMDLPLLPRKAKAVFEPFFAGESLPQYERVKTLFAQIPNYIQDLSEHGLKRLEVLKDRDHAYLKWEIWWVNTFKPPTDLSPRDIPANVLETVNMFEHLDVVQMDEQN